MIGPNKLECYISLDRKGLPWANILAYLANYTALGTLKKPREKDLENTLFRPFSTLSQVGIGLIH
jgi:hypothetical protein